MANETPVYVAPAMDRDSPIGNTEDVFLRRALHTKVGNKPSEAIPVYVTAGGSAFEFKNTYAEVNAVTSGSNTDIATYTVPVGKDFYLQSVAMSGTNIAQYTVTVDGNTVARLHTYFGGTLTTQLNFAHGADRGWKLTTGQVVKVRVIHLRPSLGDFNATIQGVEVNT